VSWRAGDFNVIVEKFNIFSIPRQWPISARSAKLGQTSGDADQVRHRRKHKTRTQRKFIMEIHSIFKSETIQLSADPRLHSRKKAFAIAAGLVAIAGLCLSAKLTASNEQDSQGSDGHPGCTLATLRGRYLFAESGVLLPPAFGVITPTQAADAGFHILNGDGSGTDTVTFRVGGNIVLESAVSPVTYTVNADCTGKYSVINGPSFDLFIAPDGSEIASISTVPAGNYPVSIARRVSQK
jgi:hypothetical protein